ncbi:MAG TPA: cation:proton antiporter [Actinomycetes bacterium]|nr:cation:proton antiporter [Actinomycetes bacterium]
MEVGTVLLHVLVVLVAAKVGAEASERLGQPAVLGELVLGVLVGPSVLGLVGHDQVLAVLAELGVLLLLLQVGLETELADLLKVGRPALTVAVVGVALPLGLGWLALRATGLAGGGRHVELFLAASLTATSVGITARVFGDLRALARAEARTVLGAAVADDVLGLVILAVMARLTSGGSAGLTLRLLLAGGAAVAFLLAGVGAGVRLAPPLFHAIERLARSDGTLIALGLAFALGFARLADLVGLAPIVGAFVAGVVLARSRTRGAIGDSLAPIAHVFVPVFFLQIGIDAGVGELLQPRRLALAGLLLAVAVVGKLLAGVAVAGSGMDPVLVGVGMLPRGEVGLIFASLGLRTGVLDAGGYGALLLVVLLTTFATPPLLRWRFGRYPAPPPAPVAGARGELVVRAGTVELAGDPPPGSRALLGLRAARLAAAARPGPRLLNWLAAGAPGPVRWTPELVAELLELLRDGRTGSWELLEGTGLLAAYLPELAAVAGRRPAAGAAPWHELGALARLAEPSRDPAAAAAWLALERPAPLLLAALVRAVTRGGVRPREAAAAARRTARRLGLGATDEEALAALVGGEADLAEAAVHTDLLDEEQVLDLAARLGDPPRARMAYLLAVAEQDDGADFQGWRRGQLDELLVRVLAAMDEPGLTDRAAENLLNRRRAEVRRLLGASAGRVADDWLAAAPRRYLLAHPAATIAAHLGMAVPPPGRQELRVALRSEPAPGSANGEPPEDRELRVDVVARDRPGLLAELAAALSAAGLDVARAHASTWPEGLVVDVFHVSGPAELAAPDLRERVQARLRRELADGSHRHHAPAAARRPGGRGGAVLVRVDAEATPWHSVVRVEAPDRPGLLAEALAELARQRIDVRVAQVGGGNGRASDVFFVTDQAGNPLDRRAGDRLGTALAGRLSGRPTP